MSITAKESVLVDDLREDGMIVILIVTGRKSTTRHG